MLGDTCRAARRGRAPHPRLGRGPRARGRRRRATGAARGALPSPQASPRGARGARDDASPARRTISSATRPPPPRAGSALSPRLHGPCRRTTPVSRPAHVREVRTFRPAAGELATPITRSEAISDHEPLTFTGPPNRYSSSVGQLPRRRHHPHTAPTRRTVAVAARSCNAPAPRPAESARRSSGRTRRVHLCSMRCRQPSM